MWGTLLHRTYSTRPLARLGRRSKCFPELVCSYICHDFTTQPFLSSSAQQCSVVSTLVSLRQRMTNSAWKAGEAWGKQKPAGRTRHSLPAPLFEGSVAVLYIEWLWTAVGLQQCLHRCWVLFGYITCIDFRREPTANGTLVSPCNRPRSQRGGRSSREAASTGCPPREGSQERRATARQVGRWSQPGGHAPAAPEQVPRRWAGSDNIQDY